MQIHSDGNAFWGTMTLKVRSNSKGELIPSDQWNDTRPVEPGWYWAFREGDQPEDMEVVCIIRHQFESDVPLLIRRAGYAYDLRNSGFTHWLGPLPVPEPPQGA